jgi:hypothetical protein
LETFADAQVTKVKLEQSKHMWEVRNNEKEFQSC